MNGEKTIDLLWEVKEGKKHPNRAYKELCSLSDISNRSELLKAFANWVQKRAWEDMDKDFEDFVEEYLHIIATSKVKP